MKAGRPVGNTWQGKDHGSVTHHAGTSHLRVARGRWAGGDSAERSLPPEPLLRPAAVRPAPYLRNGGRKRVPLL